MVRWCAGYREWGLRPDARTTGLCAAIEVAVRTARASNEGGAGVGEQPLRRAKEWLRTTAASSTQPPARSSPCATSPLAGVGGWGRRRPHSRLPAHQRATRLVHAETSEHHLVRPRAWAGDRTGHRHLARGLGEKPQQHKPANTGREAQARSCNNTTQPTPSASSQSETAGTQHTHAPTKQHAPKPQATRCNQSCVAQRPNISISSRNSDALVICVHRMKRIGTPVRKAGSQSFRSTRLDALDSGVAPKH